MVSKLFSSLHDLFPSVILILFWRASWILVFLLLPTISMNSQYNLFKLISWLFYSLHTIADTIRDAVCHTSHGEGPQVTRLEPHGCIPAHGIWSDTIITSGEGTRQPLCLSRLSFPFHGDLGSCVIRGQHHRIKGVWIPSWLQRRKT